MENSLLQAGILTRESSRILQEYSQLLASISTSINSHQFKVDEMCRLFSLSRATYYVRLKDHSWTLPEAQTYFAFLAKLEQKKAVNKTAKSKK